MRPESEIQKAFIRWLKAVYPTLARSSYKISNEGKRSFKVAAMMKAEGMVKGMVDLCIPVQSTPYGALYIEFKGPKGKLTPEQKEVMENLIHLGNHCVICWTTEEAIQETERYLMGVPKWINLN